MLNVFTELKNALGLKNADATIARGSLTGFMSKTIIECTVIVPKRLINHEHKERAINLQMDLFTANIANAFKAIIQTEGNEEVSYAFNLISSKTVLENALSIESIVPDAAYSDEVIFPLDADRVTLEDKVQKVYREIEIKVDLGDKKSITIPLLVIAPIIYATDKEMSEAITANDGSTSFPARLDEYRSGAISLVNLITGNDIIADYKKSSKNKNKILENINSSRVKSIFRLASTKAEGFVKYYRLVVITNSELEKLELVYGGKISKNRVKQRCLDTFSSLMICVLDDDFGTFDIYIRDINEKLSIPYKSTDSDNLGDLFKFMTNRTI